MHPTTDTRPPSGTTAMADPAGRVPHHSAPRRIALAVAAVALVLGTLALAPDVGAIVGGTEADDGEYPWMVALTYRDGEQFCGGSVLAEDLVLTAAHCVFDEATGAVYVEAGARTLGDPAAQRRGVAEMRIHEAWEDNDIAVLVLDEPFELDERVQPIRMVDADTHAELIDHGSPAVVTGWGATSEDGGYPDELLETTQFVVGDAECVAAYGDELALYGDELIEDLMVCANHPAGNDSCYGDSGGPLVVADPADGTWYQLGVVSFAITTCGDTAGVYTEVSGYEDFIASGGTVDGGLSTDAPLQDDPYGDDPFEDDPYADDPFLDEGDRFELPGLFELLDLFELFDDPAAAEKPADTDLDDATPDRALVRLLEDALVCAERGDTACVLDLVGAFILDELG